MSNMRIFIDVRTLNTTEPSGVPEYTRLIVRHLVSLGKDHQFLLFQNNFRKLECDWSWLNLPNVHNINYHIPNRLLDFGNKFFSLPKIDSLMPADVYYSPHINILSFNNPSRHIITLHDLSFVHHPEFFGWRERLWHWRQAYRRQLSKAGLVVTVSDFTRQDVIETFQLSPERVVRIYSGINPIYRQVKFPLPLKPFLLFLGKIEPRKNIVSVIQAFNFLKKNRRFRDFELLIAGSWGWRYVKISKEASQSPYASSIKFLGPVSESEALRLYNTASLFIYPSFFEGFGFPPLEAQACGLPVVASYQTSFPEILGQSAFLVNPNSVSEITAAIETILTNDTVRHNLVSKGFENVKKFDWNITARELISICLKLCR